MRGKLEKGFSVVADEIRKLSENSTTQSKMISEQLRAIMDSISGVVVASSESSKSFSRVTELISSIDEVSSGAATIDEIERILSSLSGKVSVSIDAISAQIDQFRIYFLQLMAPGENIQVRKIFSPRVAL